MSDVAAPTCPVCGARFRGAGECSRCGADLLPLQRLAVLAYRLRRDARRAIGEGDFAKALELARAAEEIQQTPGGQRLVLLGRWLATRLAAG